MGVSAVLEQRLDAVTNAAVAAGRVVGAVILVLERGLVRYRRAAGFFDREAEVAMTETAVFRLASVTKPMVAVTALAMTERGLLSLDDPVTRFLPGFRPRLADRRCPAITIRQLLTHTSGLAYGTQEDDDPYRRAGVSDGSDQPGLSIEENLRRIGSVPLYSAPGQKWRYSVSLDVLGALIATVHGASLDAAVAEYVTEPLAMHDTAFTVREPARLAVPYGDAYPRAVRMTEPTVVGVDPATAFMFSPVRAFDDTSFQSGGSGMVGTATDFVRFLEVIRTGGAPLLRADTMTTAVTNQIDDRRVDWLPGWGFGMLSAVLIDPAAAKSPQGRGTLAWGGTWGHWWFIDPTADLTVVSFTNTAVEGCLGSYPVDIRNAIYDP